MPLPPTNLSPVLLKQLNQFMLDNNFPDLYKNYAWENDTYVNGFPNILKLEVQISNHDVTVGINMQDVRDVAAWGKLRNPKRIDGANPILPPNTLHTPDSSPQTILSHSPEYPLNMMNVTGIGPTYKSKVLRFGFPEEYGAIDTRCVRVFGQGDSNVQQQSWIPVKARNDGYGWYIPQAQLDWLTGYNTWINILRYFSAYLNCKCPHPSSFINNNLRPATGKWYCADVEMALFTYASQFT